MHMLNFRHTGGSLHNVWVWGCPARGDGGEADVLSALLRSPVLSWWGESPAERRGGGGGGGWGERSGRIEKLRRGGSSGELPIDMHRTVGEINPRHYVLHLHSADCSSLRAAVSNTAHREVMALWLHLCVIWYLISVRRCDSVVWLTSVRPQLEILSTLGLVYQYLRECEKDMTRNMSELSLT